MGDRVARSGTITCSFRHALTFRGYSRIIAKFSPLVALKFNILSSNIDLPFRSIFGNILLWGKKRAYRPLRRGSWINQRFVRNWKFINVKWNRCNDGKFVTWKLSYRRRACAKIDIKKKKKGKRKLKKKGYVKYTRKFGPKNGKSPGKKHCIDVKCICNIRWCGDEREMYNHK